jgi:hypothetical protein
MSACGGSGPPQTSYKCVGKHLSSGQAMCEKVNIPVGHGRYHSMNECMQKCGPSSGLSYSNTCVKQHGVCGEFDNITGKCCPPNKCMGGMQTGVLYCGQ